MTSPSLFRRVLLGTIGLFAVLAIAMSIVSSKQLNDNLTAEFRARGAGIATSVASSSVEILLNRDASTLQATVDQFAEIRGVGYVVVADESGTIISHTFVPYVPELVRNIVARKRHLGDDLVIEELAIDGRGDFIDIGAPILSGVAGTVHVGMDRRVIRDEIWRAILVQQAFLLGIFAVSLVLVSVFVNRMARPLRGLTAHVNRLAQHGFTVHETDPWLQGTAAQSKDEVGELSRAFLRMEAELQNHLKLRDELAGIQRELQIAESIQTSLLPRRSSIDLGTSADLSAEMLPAKQVGGDFYDFFKLPDGRVALVAADVSGKGVPAALYMAVSRTLLRATALRSANAGQCLAELNQLLCLYTDSAMFVTVCYALLDLSTGRLEYATGGHNPPLVVRADGSVVELPQAAGVVMGMIEDVPFDSCDASLRPGDAIVLFTDGVTEALNEREELLGDDRLRACLRTTRASTSAALVQAVIADVRAFAGAADQADDVTVLALVYRG